MKPLQDCRYSAFISYSHAADDAHGGWVSQFHEELYTTLKGRLRRDVGGAVPPMHLSGDNGPVAGVLGQELERNIADSFAMIIVVDENYLASTWCLKELEYFRTLFGERGFEERLYVVAMSEPAIDQLTKTDDWKRLVPPDLVWMPFFRDNPNDRPIRVYDKNGAWSETFEDQLERMLKRLLETMRKPAPPPPSAPLRRPGAADADTDADEPPPVLLGVPAPELAAACARFAAALRQRGVEVQELGAEMLQGEFAEFDAATTLVLPLGSGGQHLKPFKFTPGGHLAAQRDAWLEKKRPEAGLLWLDLRDEPVEAPPSKGHAELLAEVGAKALAAEALLSRLQPARRTSDQQGVARGPVQRVNIYIESNQHEVDLWDDLGERIKERWRNLVQQYEPNTVPPLLLHARGLPLQQIDNERLDDADGVVLLWGNKTEDSLRAQIKKVEDKLVGDPPPGIVAYLMPQRDDPQRPIEAAYWKVLRFRDADTPNIDIVQAETDRLDRFLRKILDRTAKRKGAAGATPAPVATGAAALARV